MAPWSILLFLNNLANTFKFIIASFNTDFVLYFFSPQLASGLPFAFMCGVFSKSHVLIPKRLFPSLAHNRAASIAIADVAPMINIFFNLF